MTITHGAPVAVGVGSGTDTTGFEVGAALVCGACNDTW